MTAPLRILITGFGPFPGAPYNPTQALVARLTKLRRPALAEVELIGHVFPVSYAAVDRELPQLIASLRPDALLMFGLAARTPYLRIESRARNAVTMLWPDAAHARVRSAAIVPGADARRFGPHTEKLLRAARGTGLDARGSRDAGRYLCNYLCWRALEATDRTDGPRLAAFVHVPLVARPGAAHEQGAGHISAEQLVDAGEAVLMELLAQARRARLSLPR